MPPVSDSDLRQILQEVQGGELSEEDFRRIYCAYAPRLLGFFRRKGLSEEDCEELTQDTFVGIYKNAASLREIENLEAWIFAIASNQFRQALRRKETAKRSAITVPLDALPNDWGPVLVELDKDNFSNGLARILDEERTTQLHRAIDKLPKRMKRCLQLSLFSERSVAEISILLGISDQTVKAHLFQARKKLRLLIEEAQNDAASA